MIDSEVFIQGMGQLGGAFGREIDGPVTKMYFGILTKELTSAEFVEAVTRTIATERFWPSPAVIISKVRESGEESALKAFEHARRTIYDYGGFRFLPVSVYEAFDAPTKAAIRECGGVAKMAEANEKRFCRAYQDALTPRAPRLVSSHDKADPRIKQLTAGIGNGGRDRALPKGDAA
jgi:hypothetical protein